jgi:cytochrome c oxidase subunit 4
LGPQESLFDNTVVIQAAATMLIRSLSRAAPRASTTSSLSCTRKPASAIRTYQSTARPLSAIFQASQQPVQASSTQQSRSAHAISNPTLAGIEKRWEGMPPQEQAELWMQLRDRMKVDWNELTLQEKKAGMSLMRAHQTRELRLPAKSYMRRNLDLIRFRKVLTMWSSG